MVLIGRAVATSQALQKLPYVNVDIILFQVTLKAWLQKYETFVSNGTEHNVTEEINFYTGIHFTFWAFLYYIQE